MRLSLSVIAIAMSVTAASANEFQPALEAFLEESIREWAQSDQIVTAIKAQNADNSGMSQDKVVAMDQEWRSLVETPEAPLIAGVLTNDAADFLREQIIASFGAITEVFIMDQHGLNVAATDVTSDMWQGDEAKFQQTYQVGADAVHIGEVEHDESTQRYQGQISLTINDPATGAPIGAMTVGVDAESLL